MSRRNLLALVSLTLVSLGAAGCRGPRALGADNMTAQEASGAAGPSLPRDNSNTLGVADLLEIRVFEETDLSGPYRISPEGTVDFPLCGKVKVAGQTSSGAADLLTKCLAQGFLKHPQVTVLVREYNSKKIFVFGEVQKPGTFPYDENMSVVQAITLAGGFTKTASKNNTNVTRTVDGREKKIRVPVEDIGVGREKNFFLQPGDIVFVPESFF